MATTTKKFLEKIQARKGKLEKWEKEIIELFHARVSYQKIREYLLENNVICTRMEIYNFIHRKKRSHLINIKCANPGRAENEGTSARSENPPSGRNDETISSTGNNPTDLPKFSWTHRSKENDPKW